jgi:NADH-quinone oxidoreductase subunit M
MQMFSHGVVTGLLFVMVGVIYDKAHTRHIPDLGGLATRMPIAAVAFLVAGLAALGLPGTSGFAAEIMIFLGTFPAHGVITALATIGVLLAAGYVLWMVQRTLFGPQRERWAQLTDVSAVEAVAPMLLMAAILIVGIYPAIVSDVFRAGINDFFPRLMG